MSTIILLFPALDQTKTMNILLLEPYFTGSHADWARGFQQNGRHKVDILSLKGQFWKWRMHGGAVTLARRFMESDVHPEVILATDMLDVTTFLALTRKKTAGIPVVLYMHENQLAYPWSPDDRDIAYKRDHHYGFINYASALAADRVWFNSAYNRDSFLNALPNFLKHFPDHQDIGNVDRIRNKSDVRPLGLSLKRFDAYRTQRPEGPPIILWNHRWEYDKNPTDFFHALFQLADEGFSFRVAVCGENFRQAPQEFEQARFRLGDRLIHFGHADSFADYARLLWQSDIVPVTSNHDFFGVALAEAVYCGCTPLVPKRLAYPELLAGTNDDIFYTDYQDLVARLRHLIQSGVKVNCSHIVARFDWSNMISDYDDALEHLVQNHSGQVDKA